LYAVVEGEMLVGRVRGDEDDDDVVVFRARRRSLEETSRLKEEERKYKPVLVLIRGRTSRLRI
jgi:hypothetical protein